MLAGPQGSRSPQSARGTEVARPPLQRDPATLLDLCPGIRTSYVVRHKTLSTNSPHSFTGNSSEAGESQTAFSSMWSRPRCPHSPDTALRWKAADCWPHGEDTEHSTRLCASRILCFLF